MRSQSCCDSSQLLRPQTNQIRSRAERSGQGSLRLSTSSRKGFLYVNRVQMHGKSAMGAAAYRREHSSKFCRPVYWPAIWKAGGTTGPGRDGSYTLNSRLCWRGYCGETQGSSEHVKRIEKIQAVTLSKRLAPAASKSPPLQSKLHAFVAAASFPFDRHFTSLQRHLGAIWMHRATSRRRLPCNTSAAAVHARWLHPVLKYMQA